MSTSPSSAHPRSRGENGVLEASTGGATGSSPLTRGKLPPGLRSRACSRLIPAHAGKTSDSLSAGRRPTAHPRSRGENTTPTLKLAQIAGSSPLTRGKLQCHGLREVTGRLIPAHAGKTTISKLLPTENRAHPRSRGENSMAAWKSSRDTGSSPLTRGKPGGPLGGAGGRRLIPAHAGKTLPDLRFYCADRSDLGNP